ncbi:MAG TPA: glycosyltransferase family 4 protein [Steroidobacteraceae bacterium]|nr:glycosyltransferase family 4 protein [Steroidobacteraceae bacterium]
MKIAYFINHYPKVSHSFIRREILALERLGMHIERIALRGWEGPLPDGEDLQERQRTRYVLQRGGWPLLLPALGTLLSSPRRFLQALGLARRMSKESGRSLPYHIVYLAEACRLLSWTSAAGVRHVHAHFGTNSVEVVMLARVLGGPHYSFTVHGPEEFLSPMALEEKVHRSSFAVAISAHGCSQLFYRTRFEDWPKVKQVHCGIERGFYADAPVDGSEDGSNRLVCVGRLCEAKGQLLLVDAAAALAARGVDFELVLAGDGPLRAQLEALIRTKGLAGRVSITGWISSAEVRAQILRARALVLPSFAEGLPVVIMEAMSLRRPVISTYIGGIPELVRDGENGWLIPAGSIEELAAAIQDCLSRSGEELRRLGAAAQERVIARHDIDTEARKLAALFAEAMGSALPERC